MQPIIAESARKHGVSDEDMLHAFHNPIVFHDGDEGFLMIIGADTAARLIEVGFVTTTEGVPLIIHAMRPARERFLP